MKFESKKTENCFAGSLTYEYLIPVSGEAFAALLPPEWKIRRNEKLRRPVFIAESGGVVIKGALGGSVLRVSYQEGSFEQTKSEFEAFLGGLPG